MKGEAIRIALLGFGNVARSFARFVRTAYEGREINICAVADTSGGIIIESQDEIEQLIAHKQAGRSISQFTSAKFIAGAQNLINSLSPDDVSVVIESLPTNLIDGQPALGLLESALLKGINVVTVDKGPLANGFKLLHETADRQGLKIGFTGTIGVPIPDELAGEKVIEIEGVLNGTTNFILSEMQERGVSFRDALSTAQANGIAEPDPALDIEGWDTAVKALILSQAVMKADARLSDVERRGISPDDELMVAAGRESRRAARLVGRAFIDRNRVRIVVAPELVPEGSPLFSVTGTSKAAVFKTASNRQVVSYAKSGRDAISRTILEDVLKVINAVCN